MQFIPYSILSLVIILQALFLQGIWLFIARRARDIYLADIMHFRTPRSALSRYYDWRVSRFLNALMEGIVFLIMLLASIILVSLAMADFSAFLDAIFYVVFVMFLSFLSAMQTTWRVKEINEQENRILASLTSSIDKVGTTREMVENLISQGAMGDGRVWFALYRLAQRQNQVGWAVRDILIEKGKEMKEMDKYTQREQESISRDKGPGIES